MAVTKTNGPEAVSTALQAGIRHIGENRVQEAAGKFPQVAEWSPDALSELIGPLQRNKVKLALETFDRIQTVDRLSLVERMERVLEDLGRSIYPVLLQVNVGKDPAKQGCDEELAPELLERMQSGGRLKVDGLMTIGALTNDAGEIRRTFAGLRELRDRLAAESGLPLSELSMGMSGDLEVAIEEGSTLIRVGSALFGPRS